MKTIDIERATQVLMLAMNAAAEQYVKGWTPSTGDEPLADPIVGFINNEYKVAVVPTPVAMNMISSNVVKAAMPGAFMDVINEEGSQVIAGLVVSEAFFNHLDKEGMKDKEANGGSLRGLEGTRSCIMGELYHASGIRLFCQRLKVGERDGPIEELGGPGVTMTGNFAGKPVSDDDLANGAEE